MTPDSRRISVNQNGSLYFQSIKRKKRKGLDDEGLYECQKTFTVGTVIVRRVKVQIASRSKVKFVISIIRSNNANYKGMP